MGSIRKNMLSNVTWLRRMLLIQTTMFLFTIVIWYSNNLNPKTKTEAEMVYHDIIHPLGEIDQSLTKSKNKRSFVCILFFECCFFFINWYLFFPHIIDI